MTIEQALQAARERVWRAIKADPQMPVEPWKRGVNSALDANDALVAAVAKLAGMREAHESHGDAGCYERRDGYECPYVDAARAEVDRLVAAMREEGA